MLDAAISLLHLDMGWYDERDHEHWHAHAHAHAHTHTHTHTPNTHSYTPRAFVRWARAFTHTHTHTHTQNRLLPDAVFKVGGAVVSLRERGT